MRVSTIDKEFVRRYGREPEWLIAAPGRVNLIGEHTDYNDGFVLPMAIERYTLLAAARGQDSAEPVVNAYSVNLGEHECFALHNLEATGPWTDYIKGVVAEFLDRGLAPGSLDLLVDSDIPMGCGLSSSAALQVATAHLLRQLQTELVDDDAVPALCQEAEHRFAGVPVGIMDPFCIANARKDHAVYLDCRTLHANYIPLDDPDVVTLIVDSRVSRKLRSGAYAERRIQCEQASRILGVRNLRDASVTVVEANRESLGDVCFRRARHVTGENVRTAEAVTAMRDRNWLRFGELMYQSHESLRSDFEVSCTELDILVDTMQKIGLGGGVFGARMTGGGFGGCIVALIQRSGMASIRDRLTVAYRAATGKELGAYASSPADGVRLLSHLTRESL